MKRLIIFMILLSFLLVPGPAYSKHETFGDVPPGPSEIIKSQQADLVRAKAFVKDLREKLPAETYIVTKNNFIQTTDMIEYLLQKHGWKPKDYSIVAGVVDDENGTYAIYNIYIRLWSFGATFITEGTFEWQDIEPQEEL